jgi:hypothetical protein
LITGPWQDMEKYVKNPSIEEILKTRLWNSSVEKLKKILKSLVPTK